MDQVHKSRNAPVPYPKMHHSEQVYMCTFFVLNGALRDMELVHGGIYEICLVSNHRKLDCWLLSPSHWILWMCFINKCRNPVDFVGFYFKRLDDQVLFQRTKDAHNLPSRGACCEDFVSVTSITMTSWWARWRLKSPVSRLFTQAFIQAQIKENIKAPRHWPLWGEFTGDRWIPRTKGQ